jgi:hypothetical protein
MLALLERPADTYRRVEFDAQVEGSDGAGLTRLCLDRAIVALGRARRARERGVRVEALGQAASALFALREGVSHDNPLRTALVQFYGSARAAVMASVARFDAARLEAVERDLQEVLALLS